MPIIVFHFLAFLGFYIAGAGGSATPPVSGATPSACPTASCGKATDIRYPFWLSPPTPSPSPATAPEAYCGYPNFMITCTGDDLDNQTPILAVNGKNYTVTSINYDARIITLGAGGGIPPCPRGVQTLDSLAAGALLSLTDGDAFLDFYFNCTISADTYFAYSMSACSDAAAGSYSYVYPDGQAPAAISSRGNCSGVVRAPVLRLAAAASTSDALVKLLTGGFELTWVQEFPSGDCSDCESTGGMCGGNTTGAVAGAGTFVCFCKDGPHPRNCGKSSSSGTNIAIGISVAIGGLILVSILVFLWLRRKKRQQLTSSVRLNSVSSELPSSFDPELGSPDYQTHLFSYKELNDATDCFDASKELGDGGFGTVYKGKLRDGRTVAVKRLYENNYKRVEQFMNEISILSRLRHPNLVTLYGCTSHQSRELVLVYEFVSNGTVADHLHGPRASEGPLSWPTRLNIAIQTADALSYLHAIDPPIIHRDIKTNNILLDCCFHVKVADFGLSRLFPINATHVSTLPQGTPGYVDPEYHRCYQLTDKSDVYSFGVVLMELISSKPAVDITRHRHDINLAAMAISRIQNRELEQIVDPALGYESNGNVRSAVDDIAEVAFRCLQGDGEMRPPIKEVLESMRDIASRFYDAEKAGDALIDHAMLKKSSPPFSPNSVTHQWSSIETTPSNSG